GVHGDVTGRLVEQDPVGARQAEGLGQQAGRLPARAAGPSQLQVPDGPDADAGRRGELLLGETGAFAGQLERPAVPRGPGGLGMRAPRLWPVRFHSAEAHRHAAPPAAAWDGPAGEPSAPGPFQPMSPSRTAGRLASQPMSAGSASRFGASQPMSPGRGPLPALFQPMSPGRWPLPALFQPMSFAHTLACCPLPSVPSDPPTPASRAPDP